MGRARTPQLGDFSIDWTPGLRERHAVLCTYYPWLASVNEAYQFRMATQSLYRPAVVFGRGRAASSQEPNPAPWRAVPAARITAWRARDLAERWATTDTIAQALAWLDETFGGYDNPEAARQ